MPKNHDNQNTTTEIRINAGGQENHVCMQHFHHGNPGSMVLFLLAGYGLSNGDVGGHTWKGNFRNCNMF